MSARSDARQALADLITANLDMLAAVYSYQKTDLQGQTPVVAITSGGSNRQPLTSRGSSATYTLDVHLFVLHRDPAANWDEEQAEALLDEIEAALGALLDANRRNPPAWQRISYSGPSNASETITLNGQVYLHEVVSLDVLTI